MTPMRPTALIAAELADAEAMAAATRGAERTDPLVDDMLASNDREIERLRAELADARSSDLEISIDGRPVFEHRITSSYLARLLADTQSAYRAAVEAVADDKPSLLESSLLVDSTAPGSFRVRFRTAAEPLSILESPRSERALSLLFEMVEASADQRRAWVERTDEAAVRSFIRFAATLASSQGVARLRWTKPTSGVDRVVVVTAASARTMAADLAGTPESEIVTVEGHLSRAQDDPPRVRVTRPNGDDETADVLDAELLPLVQELLFSDVRATIAIQMTTSPTTGAPSTRGELLNLERLEP